MAVLLTWALFFGWTAIGLAVLNAAGLRNGARKLLLAPALGVVPAAVLAYTGVKLGFPVRESGVVIGIAVLALTLAALWLTRGPLERVLVTARRQLPFAGVLVAAFALTAWPLFKFGYDWVANGNDDYANYCLGATGFREHGYLRTPTLPELRTQNDLTQPLWWMYHSDTSAYECRTGAELTLALVSVWTGLSPQQAFMSVLAALNLALVSAAAGMVLCATRRRGVALTAAALLAVSSQTTYGVVQQLIAQAIGIALLCAALALLRAPVRHLPYRGVARRALACGTAFAGLILFYPEAVPFLVCGAVALGLRDLLVRRPVRKHLWHATAAVAVMVLALPAYLVGVTVFLIGQGAQGTGSATATVEIFPYFMTPRGPALVSGLLPYVHDLPGALHGLALVTGCAVLVALVWVAARQFARGRAPAGVLAVMVALGALLYAKSAAFGLFKIAMFIQPFLWASLALWAAERAGWGRRAAVAALLFVGGLNVYTQGYYTRRSTGYDGRVDLPVATQQRLMREFRAALAARPAGDIDRVVFACDNSVLLKLLTAEALGPAHTQLSMASYFRLSSQAESSKQNGREPLTLDPFADALPEVRDPATGARLHWLVHHPADWTRDDPKRVLFVAGVGPLSVLNRQRFPESGTGLLAAPLTAVRNFAVFRDATGARHNFWGMDDASQIALAALEPDPALRHRTLAALGTALVVEVVNPTPKVRAVVSYTSTYLPDPDQRTIPNIEIVGGARVPLGGTGAGSVRLVSPPVAPQRAGADTVLVLDVNKPRVRNPNRLTGIEALWGTHLHRDRRQLTGHLREFSVISEEEYAAFVPPERIAKIPADLGHPHAEYSGVMEDGWLGREFKARLTCGANRDLVVRGQVPGIDPNFRTSVTVLIDGSPVLARELPAGDFELRAPAGAGGGPKWVELRFDRTTALPQPDGRTVSAFLRHIGFEQAQTEGTARR